MDDSVLAVGSARDWSVAGDCESSGIWLCGFSDAWSTGHFAGLDDKSEVCLIGQAELEGCTEPVEAGVVMEGGGGAFCEVVWPIEVKKRTALNRAG